MTTPGEAISVLVIVAWLVLAGEVFCFGAALICEMSHWRNDAYRIRCRNNWVTAGIGVSIVGMLLTAVLVTVGNAL